MNTIHKQLT